MACSLEAHVYAPVRPDDLLTCYHIARCCAATLPPPGVLPAEVEVCHHGQIVRVPAGNPVGRMMGAVQRMLPVLPHTDYLPVTSRLMLLFDLAQEPDSSLQHWLRMREGWLEVHDSLVRAAALAPVREDGEGFDVHVLRDLAERFDHDWQTRTEMPFTVALA